MQQNKPRGFGEVASDGAYNDKGQRASKYWQLKRCDAKEGQKSETPRDLNVLPHPFKEHASPELQAAPRPQQKNSHCLRKAVGWDGMTASLNYAPNH